MRARMGPLFLLHGFTYDSETYQAEGKTTLTNDVPGVFTTSLTAHPKRWPH